MGERSIIIFSQTGLNGFEKDDSQISISPAIYIHWTPDNLIDMLQAFAPHCDKGRADYACARFLGVLNERIPGNMSLGVGNVEIDTEKTDLSIKALGEYYKESWLDAGCLLVCTTTGKLTMLAPGWLNQKYNPKTDTTKTFRLPTLKFNNPSMGSRDTIPFKKISQVAATNPH